ncbi:MAG TPA: nucleoside diphosphate kinase regulator [Smithellaceae bacterium]|jgi:regulator of nucleoside diphosphate kinase|nr:nucleoside diphosphate kinase regulator [Smithellaceae bacterium]
MNIYITKNDHKKLIELINEKLLNDDYTRTLFLELEKATIVESEKIPADVITMNSLIIFKDVESGAELEYWLVFPQDADISQHKISVVSPVGCALLGYKVSDIINLKTPGGERKIKVIKILHQPEAEGNYE